MHPVCAVKERCWDNGFAVPRYRMGSKKRSLWRNFRNHVKQTCFERCHGNNVGVSARKLMYRELFKRFSKQKKRRFMLKRRASFMEPPCFKQKQAFKNFRWQTDPYCRG